MYYLLRLVLIILFNTILYCLHLNNISILQIINGSKEIRP